jgi:hypothetical protein
MRVRPFGERRSEVESKVKVKIEEKMLNGRRNFCAGTSPGLPGKTNKAEK